MNGDGGCGFESEPEGGDFAGFLDVVRENSDMAGLVELPPIGGLRAIFGIEHGAHEITAAILRGSFWLGIGAFFLVVKFPCADDVEVEDEGGGDLVGVVVVEPVAGEGEFDLVVVAQGA